MYKVSIPEISKQELLYRYKRIKPIVEIDGKKYFLREYTESELTCISYIWNAIEDKREPVDMAKYIPLRHSDFDCIHKHGYSASFRPSIAEVLAQITEKDLRIACAFEIIESPESTADCIKHQVIFDNGFLVSKVRLYYKK